jgi:hypothetical protein
VPAHLQLTDPITQYGRWYFQLKQYLTTLDPRYTTLFEGRDEGNQLYHYQWAVAKLLNNLVSDRDAAYVVASRIRLHPDTPGSAALTGLADAYQYDPVDHAQRLRAELHRPIQPGNTLRGYLSDLTRIREEMHDLGHAVGDQELITCLVNGLRVPEYMAERNYLVHHPQTNFEVACGLCRKTAIQDTIVAGVAGSLTPAAFYTGAPAPPSLMAVAAPVPPSPPNARQRLSLHQHQLDLITY